MPSEPSSTPICQRCGGETEYGCAIVRNPGRRLSWLIRGSHPLTKLLFAPDGDLNATAELMAQERGCEAFRCLKCGALNLSKRRWIG